jgi:ABC-type uncharacterized transport system substrate-binding protein
MRRIRFAVVLTLALLPPLVAEAQGPGANDAWWSLGLIASLARPGGNVTGVSYSVGTDIFGKDLELLKEVVPKVRRVAVLSNPDSPAQPLTIGNIQVRADEIIQ